jgi:hypothetical protein
MRSAGGSNARACAIMMRWCATSLVHSDDEGERVATPHGGHWRGKMLMIQGMDKQTARARSVRTWVAD